MTSICSWMEDVGVGQRAASFPPGNMVHIDVVQNAESLGEKPLELSASANVVLGQTYLWILKSYLITVNQL